MCNVGKIQGFNAALCNVLHLLKHAVYIVVVTCTGIPVIYGVNEPCPRVQPEDKVCLHCHKSQAAVPYYVIHISH